jgi:hypothetical protein
MKLGAFIKSKLLEQIGILFSDKSTFTRIKNIVARVDENQIASGVSKKEYAITEIKEIGISLGGYILNLIIEICVALLREGQQKIK